MRQNVKLNPGPWASGAQDIRELVPIKPNVGGNEFSINSTDFISQTAQLSMDSTMQAYVSTMQEKTSLTDDVLVFLLQAFMNMETFPFFNIIPDSDGQAVYFPMWSCAQFHGQLQIEAPGHRDFIKNNITVTQDDFASYSRSLCSSSSSVYAASERSTRSCSPCSGSDSGSDLYEFNQPPVVTRQTFQLTFPKGTATIGFNSVSPLDVSPYHHHLLVNFMTALKQYFVDVYFNSISLKLEDTYAEVRKKPADLPDDLLDRILTDDARLRCTPEHLAYLTHTEKVEYLNSWLQQTNEDPVFNVRSGTNLVFTIDDVENYSSSIEDNLWMDYQTSLTTVPGLSDLLLTKGTSEERKTFVRLFGEDLFRDVLVQAPNLLRASSKNYDRVIKILGKTRNLTKMIEFLKDRHAFNFAQVVNAAMIEGAGGVAVIIEYTDPESLEEVMASLEKRYPELAKNTQIVELHVFTATGVLYKFSKFAYQISQYIARILQAKDGVQILEQTMGEFSDMDLKAQTWSGIEDYFGNKDAISVAERYSQADLRKMDDLCKRLRYRVKLTERGYGLQEIQTELSQVVNNLSHLHTIIPTFKTNFKLDASEEKRERNIRNCEDEIYQHENDPKKKGHVKTQKERLKKLIDERADRKRKANGKSKAFMEKNGLSDYKVLSEEAEADKSYSAFDEAIRDKGMEESERVYHILMEEIEKVKSDASVTQSNTEKKKASNRSGKRSTKPQKWNRSKACQRKKNYRGCSGKKTYKSQSKGKATRV